MGITPNVNMVEIAKNHGISNTFVMVCAMILIPIMLFIAYQFVQMLTKEGAEGKEGKDEKTVRIQKGLAWLDLALYLDSSSMSGVASVIVNQAPRDNLLDFST